MSQGFTKRAPALGVQRQPPPHESHRRERQVVMFTTRIRALAGMSLPASAIGLAAFGASLGTLIPKLRRVLTGISVLS